MAYAYPMSEQDWHSVLRDVVSIDPAIMHGTPCFAGTRVPVQRSSIICRETLRSTNF